MGRIIDGRAIAAQVRARLAEEVTDLASQGVRPCLAVVLIGGDPASEVYVRSKTKQAAEIGLLTQDHRLANEATEVELLSLISALNADNEVDGILVQLPLPAHISTERVLRAIDPAKDVDGFHPSNVGLLTTGAPGLTPCTPKGAMHLICSVRPNIAGLHAVVVGCSNIVGRPMAQLLLQAGCTVTVTHLLTRALTRHTRRADILVVAAGAPGLIQSDAIKPGAIVIDVGITRVLGPNGKACIVGDVAPGAVEVAGAFTPVPGGVGPMTIACLLDNTLQAAKARRGLMPGQIPVGGAQSTLSPEICVPR